MRIAQEEIFGSVVSLIPVGSFEEAIEANNDVAYGLSSSIFTNDVNQVFKAQRDLDTGIVYVNAGTTGAEIHLPFGGRSEEHTSELQSRGQHVGRLLLVEKKIKLHLYMI